MGAPHPPREFKIGEPGRVYVPGKQRYVKGPEQDLELGSTKTSVQQITSLQKGESSPYGHRFWCTKLSSGKGICW